MTTPTCDDVIFLPEDDDVWLRFIFYLLLADMIKFGDVGLRYKTVSSYKMNDE